MIVHSPGEDVSLYYRIIDLLSKNGYESFFCQMTNVYNQNVDIYREINRILEMCIIDLDKQQYIKSHKLHLMGCFIGGSRILNYCVKGRFKHRLKSVIVVNPLIMPTNEFKSSMKHAATSFVATFLPKTQITAFPIKYEHLTNDDKWIEYLKTKNYNFTSVNANYLREILHISHILQNEKKFQAFSVKNVLLVHSMQDPICFSSGIKQFREHCPAENVQGLEYEDGMNNLFIESNFVFEKFGNDLLRWLEEN